KNGQLLPEGIHPVISELTGEITYRARVTYGPKSARRHLSKTEKTASAAIEWRLKKQIEVNLGQTIDPSTFTCNEYIESWYSLGERTWSVSRALTVENA